MNLTQRIEATEDMVVLELRRMIDYYLSAIDSATIDGMIDAEYAKALMYEMSLKYRGVNVGPHN